MATMTRRSFVGTLALGSSNVALGGLFQGRETPPGAPVSIRVNLDKILATVPRNYTGLSYESAQLGHPDFFAPTNKALVAFFRQLAKYGVLRTGGNTSEFTVWSPSTAAAGVTTAVSVDPSGSEEGPEPRTSVTPEAIRNLADFLDATGWDLIYGLNLGTGTPEQAAQEAKAVSDAVGRRLITFQIGNEPDLFHRNRPYDLRPADWAFSNYLPQWREFAQAVRKAVPNAAIGAPDVSNVAIDMDWITQFAEQAANEISLWSGHYYALGPPTDPSMNLDRLLKRDPRLLTSTPRTMDVSRNTHHPFRMMECQSCWDGGKRGVSDVFASALWAADYMLFLAQGGYAGVNFHGGGKGVYTPIAGGIEAGFSARPIYYGVLMGEQFAGSTMVETRVELGAVNATAYAAKKGSGVRVAIFNKDERQAIRVTLSLDTHAHKAKLWHLSAPSMESKAEVRFAGAEVSPDGVWAAKQEESLTGSGGRYTIDLPSASAVLVFLD